MKRLSLSLTLFVVSYLFGPASAPAQAAAAHDRIGRTESKVRSTKRTAITIAQARPIPTSPQVAADSYAVSGQNSAGLALGRLYLDDDGVEKNPAKGLALFIKAANLGSA
ncbi:MAG: SEL1-like repeat protein [Pseudolabrys sp.]|jgi:TPR repeat protein